MPTIRFTQNIQRHVPCPIAQVPGRTVRESLEAYFTLHPRARGYVLDDQVRLRRHMAIFIDGAQVLNRDTLDDPVRDEAVIDIVQALSGG